MTKFSSSKLLMTLSALAVGAVVGCSPAPAPAQSPVQAPAEAPAPQAEAPPPVVAVPRLGQDDEDYGAPEKAWRKLPKGFDPSGRYRQRDPKGELTIEPAGPGRWRVSVRSEAPYREVGMPTPCAMVTEGSFEGARLFTVIVPFETDEFSTDETLPDKALYLDFSKDTVWVIDRASFGFCGLHSGVSGDYHRVK